MNILFTALFRISPNSGGVQRVTETLAKEFVDQNHKVFYLSISEGVEEKIKGIYQYYLPNGRVLDSEENKSYLKNVIDNNKIQIVVNQTGFRPNVLGFLRNDTDSQLKIFTVHHNCLKCLNEQYHNIYGPTLKAKRLYNIFNNKLGWLLLKGIHKYKFSKEIKKSVSLSDKIVLLSDKFIPDFNFYLPNIDKSKIIGIPNPNPFNVNDVKICLKENRLIFVGRLSVTQKRVERIIEIWENVFNEFPNWQLDIVGDGPDRHIFEGLVKKKNLDRVNFYGFRDPRPFLSKAKIFLMTSDFEGFGMVLVEAQTYGVVPISFDCFSSITDIIKDGVTGKIIKHFNLGDYIKEIKLLMRNELKLNNMSEKGKTSIEIYNSGVIAEIWLKLFEKNE